MDRRTFERLLQEQKAIPVITAEELAEGGDRTLTLGYNFQRETVHVYLKDGEIHWLYYTSAGILGKQSAEKAWAESLLPSKRVYPEYTDVQFARLMKERTEFGLPFTKWSEPKKEGPFYGRVV